MIGSRQTAGGDPIMKMLLLAAGVAGFPFLTGKEAQRAETISKLCEAARAVEKAYVGTNSKTIRIVFDPPAEITCQKVTSDVTHDRPTRPVQESKEP